MEEIEKEKLKKFLRLSGYERLYDWQVSAIEKAIDTIRKSPDYKLEIVSNAIRQTYHGSIYIDQLFLLGMLFESYKEKM